MKLKLISSTVNAERRFSSWIGGSILASLVRRWPLVFYVSKFFNIVGEGIILSGCSSVIRSFIHADFVTTISHERLEQS